MDYITYHSLYTIYIVQLQSKFVKSIFITAVNTLAVLCPKKYLGTKSKPGTGHC
jgi:hypothetical protein